MKRRSSKRAAMLAPVLRVVEKMREDEWRRRREKSDATNN